MTTLLWLRQDLRLADQPALRAALDRGGPVIAAYVLDDETPGPWRLGGAARWWLHHSLAALGPGLEALGIPLILRRGPAGHVIPTLAKEIGAEAIYWCRQYEPYARARDSALKSVLRAQGLTAESFNGALLFEPWTVTKTDGTPYQVFSAFWRACQAAPSPPAPLPAPRSQGPAPRVPGSLVLEQLALLPRRPDWAGGFRARWTPGETAARAKLAQFLKNALTGYEATRDEPGREGTSMLSSHLHFGEISPRLIWQTVHAHLHQHPRDAGSVRKFLSEIGWREFAHHLLFYHPELPESPLDKSFSNFSWERDEDAFDAWTRGMTGYPIVDAGMRELWRTGYMHNRVRMIAASFLVKDLLLPWQRGQAWFWDTLVDADLANNATGWQWVTGSGADAAPYFRILNPVLQGERFDPEGVYVRRYVPELGELPTRFIHQPWTASPDVLSAARLRLGVDYPRPLVVHATARQRALDRRKTAQRSL